MAPLDSWAVAVIFWKIEPTHLTSPLEANQSSVKRRTSPRTCLGNRRQAFFSWCHCPGNFWKHIAKEEALWVWTPHEPLQMGQALMKPAHYQKRWKTCWTLFTTEITLVVLPAAWGYWWRQKEGEMEREKMTVLKFPSSRWHIFFQHLCSKKASWKHIYPRPLHLRFWVRSIVWNCFWWTSLTFECF